MQTRCVRGLRAGVEGVAGRRAYVLAVGHTDGSEHSHRAPRTDRTTTHPPTRPPTRHPTKHHCTPHRMNWMVNTMPTNAAVSRHTPSERGPTRLSCSSVLRQCTLPARREGRQGVAGSRGCWERGATRAGRHTARPRAHPAGCGPAPPHPAPAPPVCATTPWAACTRTLQWRTSAKARERRRRRRPVLPRLRCCCCCPPPPRPSHAVGAGARARGQRACPRAAAPGHPAASGPPAAAQRGRPPPRRVLGIGVKWRGRTTRAAPQPSPSLQLQHWRTLADRLPGREGGVLKERVMQVVRCKRRRGHTRRLGRRHVGMSDAPPPTAHLPRSHL